MRSHEERIAEVRRRIAEKERQKRRKQRRIVAITCIAVQAQPAPSKRQAQA